MIGKGRKTGQIRFALSPAGPADRVAVAGDFTDWTPQTLRRQKSGQYVANINVPPGSHEYKFVVDGQWMLDPDNGQMALNPYGTFNSVLIVE